MRSIVTAIAVVSVAAGLVASTAEVAAAQTVPAPGSLSVPITGTGSAGVRFSGKLTVVEFKARGNAIVAIGFLNGTLERGNRTLGSVVQGPLELPVNVAQRTSLGGTAARGGGFRLALGEPDMIRSGRIILAQAPAPTCPVLHLDIGAVAVNLLGFQVSLSPVVLDIGGIEGQPLGDLVCQVTELLGNVVGLVGLLNQILGLLTGLLGGLTSGLGGAVTP
jgi:hypothetical protein